MAELEVIINAAMGLFRREFTIYGFTFSFWNVFLFLLVAGIVIWMIGRFFD